MEQKDFYNCKQMVLDWINTIPETKCLTVNDISEVFSGDVIYEILKYLVKQLKKEKYLKQKLDRIKHSSIENRIELIVNFISIFTNTNNLCVTSEEEFVVDLLFRIKSIFDNIRTFDEKFFSKLNNISLDKNDHFNSQNNKFIENQIINNQNINQDTVKSYNNNNNNEDDPRTYDCNHRYNNISTNGDKFNKLSISSKIESFSIFKNNPKDINIDTKNAITNASDLKKVNTNTSNIFCNKAIQETFDLLIKKEEFELKLLRGNLNNTKINLSYIKHNNDKLINSNNQLNNNSIYIDKDVKINILKFNKPTNPISSVNSTAVKIFNKYEYKPLLTKQEKYFYAEELKKVYQEQLNNIKNEQCDSPNKTLPVEYNSSNNKIENNNNKSINNNIKFTNDSVVYNYNSSLNKKEKLQNVLEKNTLKIKNNSDEKLNNLFFSNNLSIDEAILFSKYMKMTDWILSISKPLGFNNIDYNIRSINKNYTNINNKEKNNYHKTLDLNKLINISKDGVFIADLISRLEGRSVSISGIMRNNNNNVMLNKNKKQIQLNFDKICKFLYNKDNFPNKDFLIGLNYKENHYILILLYNIYIYYTKGILSKINKNSVISLCAFIKEVEERNNIETNESNKINIPNSSYNYDIVKSKENISKSKEKEYYANIINEFNNKDKITKNYDNLKNINKNSKEFNDKSYISSFISYYNKLYDNKQTKNKSNVLLNKINFLHNNNKLKESYLNQYEDRISRNNKFTNESKKLKSYYDSKEKDCIFSCNTNNINTLKVNNKNYNNSNKDNNNFSKYKYILNHNKDFKNNQNISNDQKDLNTKSISFLEYNIKRHASYSNDYLKNCNQSEYKSKNKSQHKIANKNNLPNRNQYTKIIKINSNSFNDLKENIKKWLISLGIKIAVSIDFDKKHLTEFKDG